MLLPVFALTLLLMLINSKHAYAQTLAGCIEGACVSTGTRLADVGEGDLLNGLYRGLLQTNEPLNISVADWGGLRAYMSRWVICKRSLAQPRRTKC